MNATAACFTGEAAAAAPPPATERSGTAAARGPDARLWKSRGRVTRWLGGALQPPPPLPDRARRRALVNHKAHGGWGGLHPIAVLRRTGTLGQDGGHRPQCVGVLLLRAP